MDRFIDNILLAQTEKEAILKSNMDRFIVVVGTSGAGKSMAFKIQYG